MNFVQKKLVSEYPNQFDPYCVFGNNLQSTFNGTIFRFPLRTKEMEGVTDLPLTTWDTDQIKELFSKYFQEAHYSLLFLKNVERITFYIRNDLELKEIFNVSVNMIGNAAQQKSIIPNFISKISSRYADIEEEEFEHTVLFLIDYETNDLVTSKQSRVKWLICNQLDSSILSFSKYAYSTAIKLIPWTGVAVPLSFDEPIFEQIQKTSIGKLFCFLPLPLEHHLPININGYFAVASNRRDIWKGANALQGDARNKAEWNDQLISTSIPINYIKIIEYLRNNFVEYNIQVSKFYSVFPSDMTNDFSPIVNSFYQILVKRNIPCFLNTTNQWVDINNAYFLNSRILEDDTTDLDEELINFIVSLFENHKSIVINCPHAILEEFGKVGVVIHKITPQIIRDWIRFIPINFSDHLDHLPKLIEFLLCDKKIDDFEGLPIIPLKNHSTMQIHKITDANTHQIYFSLSEENISKFILPKMDDHIIDLAPEIINHFLDRHFNVKSLSFHLFLKYLLPILFDQHIDDNNYKVIDLDESFLSVEYLENLWKYLTPELIDELQVNVPIILTINKKLYSFKEVNKLISFNELEEKNDGVVKVLEQFGVTFIDITLKLNQCAIHYNFKGIIKALVQSVEGGDVSTLISKFKTLSSSDRACLSNFIHSRLKKEGINLKDLNPTEIKIMGSVSTDLEFLMFQSDETPFHLKEELTDRISKIIRDYGSNINMLKEMLQNADDAGASDMKIIFDLHHYNSNHIFNKGDVLNGPSIIITNNSEFSNEDLVGIQSIGRGSKANSDKIGQFGIGFNSVYYYTDTPCIITRDLFLMLDPSNSLLPDTNGLKLKIPNILENEMMAGLINPFQWMEELDNEKKTIFRFPLRLFSASCKEYLLSNWTYGGKQAITEIIENTHQWIADSLIFLSNIKSISIFVRENEKLNPVYSIQKDIIHSYIDQPSKNFKLHKFTITEQFFDWGSQKRQQKPPSTWVTVDSNEPLNDRKLYEKFTSAKIKVVPFACVAYCLSQQNNIIDLNQDLQKERINNDMQFDWKEDNLQNFKGKFFCYLPLSIENNLKMHISAPFGVDSCRKGLIMDSVNEKLWNEFLLTKNVARALVQLYFYLCKVEKRNLNIHFPLNYENLPILDSLAQEFYRYSIEQQLSIFATSIGPRSFDNTYFIFDPDNHEFLSKIFNDKSICPINNNYIEKLANRKCVSPNVVVKWLKRKDIFTKYHNSDRKSCQIPLLTYISQLPFTSMNDLQILPLLAPKRFGTIVSPYQGTGGHYLIEPKLVKCLNRMDRNQFIDTSVYSLFHPLITAKGSNVNIMLFTLEILSESEDKVLPVEWKSMEKIKIVESEMPKDKWFSAIYEIIKSCGAQIRDQFLTWPILNFGGYLYRVRSPNYSILVEHSYISRETKEVLSLLDCIVMDEDKIKNNHELFLQYLPSNKSSLGLISCLKTQYHEKMAKLSQKIDQLAPNQKGLLFSELFQKIKDIDRINFDKTMFEFIKELPIFHCCDGNYYAYNQIANSQKEFRDSPEIYAGHAFTSLSYRFLVVNIKSIPSQCESFLQIMNIQSWNEFESLKTIIDDQEQTTNNTTLCLLILDIIKRFYNVRGIKQYIQNKKLFYCHNDDNWKSSKELIASPIYPQIPKIFETILSLNIELPFVLFENNDIDERKLQKIIDYLNISQKISPLIFAKLCAIIDDSMVNNQSEQDQETLLELSSSLFSYFLDKENYNELSKVEQIKNYRWVAICKSITIGDISYPISIDKFAKFQEIRSNEDLRYAGFNYKVCQFSFANHVATRQLNLTDFLNNLIKFRSQIEGNSPYINEFLRDHLKKISSILSSRYCDKGTNELLNYLKGVDVIPINDTKVLKPSSCYVDSDLDLSPIFYRIPAELKFNSILCELLGILQPTLDQAYKTMEYYKEKNILQNDEFDKYIKIIEFIVDCNYSKDRLFLPTISYRLVPFTKILFIETRMLDKIPVNYQNSLDILHGSFPPLLVRKLGLQINNKKFCEAISEPLAITPEKSNESNEKQILQFFNETINICRKANASKIDLIIHHQPNFFKCLPICTEDVYNSHLLYIIIDKPLANLNEIYQTMLKYYSLYCVLFENTLAIVDMGCNLCSNGGLKFDLSKLNIFDIFPDFGKYFSAGCNEPVVIPTQQTLFIIPFITSTNIISIVQSFIDYSSITYFTNTLQSISISIIPQNGNHKMLYSITATQIKRTPILWGVDVEEFADSNSRTIQYDLINDHNVQIFVPTTSIDDLPKKIDIRQLQHFNYNWKKEKNAIYSICNQVICPCSHSEINFVMSFERPLNSTKIANCIAAAMKHYTTKCERDSLFLLPLSPELKIDNQSLILELRDAILPIPIFSVGNTPKKVNEVILGNILPQELFDLFSKFQPLVRINDQVLQFLKYNKISPRDCTFEDIAPKLIQNITPEQLLYCINSYNNLKFKINLSAFGNVPILPTLDRKIHSIQHSGLVYQRDVIYYLRKNSFSPLREYLFKFLPSKFLDRKTEIFPKHFMTSIASEVKSKSVSQLINFKVFEEEDLLYLITNPIIEMNDSDDCVNFLLKAWQIPTLRAKLETMDQSQIIPAYCHYTRKNKIISKEYLYLMDIDKTHFLYPLSEKLRFATPLPNIKVTITSEKRCYQLLRLIAKHHNDLDDQSRGIIFKYFCIHFYSLKNMSATQEYSFINSNSIKRLPIFPIFGEDKEIFQTIDIDTLPIKQDSFTERIPSYIRTSTKIFIITPENGDLMEFLNVKTKDEMYFTKLRDYLQVLSMNPNNQIEYSQIARDLIKKKVSCVKVINEEGDYCNACNLFRKVVFLETLSNFPQFFLHKEFQEVEPILGTDYDYNYNFSKISIVKLMKIFREISISRVNIIGFTNLILQAGNDILTDPEIIDLIYTSPIFFSENQDNNNNNNNIVPNQDNKENNIIYLQHENFFELSKLSFGDCEELVDEIYPPLSPKFKRIIQLINFPIPPLDDVIRNLQKISRTSQNSAFTTIKKKITNIFDLVNKKYKLTIKDKENLFLQLSSEKFIPIKNIDNYNYRLYSPNSISFNLSRDESTLHSTYLPKYLEPFKETLEILGAKKVNISKYTIRITTPELFQKKQMETFENAFDEEYFADVIWKFDNRAIFTHAMMFRLNEPLISLIKRHRTNNKTIFPIVDISYDSYYLFLKYFYTGNIDLDHGSKIDELLDLCARYNCKELTTLIEDILINGNYLNHKLALPLIVSARKFDAENLSLACLDVMKDHLNVLLDDPDYHEFMTLFPEIHNDLVIAAQTNEINLNNLL